MKANPKPRKLTQRQASDAVCQAFVVRTACLELLYRVKDPAARCEIIKLGKAADEAISTYGGVVWGEPFEALAHRIILESER